MWAGGKNKMIPKYLDTPGIPLSGYDTFVEPFFGGGAMTVWMAQNNPSVKRFVINDFKSELMGIYLSIQSDVTGFCARMDKLSSDFLPLDKPSRKSYFYNLRLEYTSDYAKWNSVEESATLYFLMKTAFNGIWQVNQKDNPAGRFSTPCGLVNQKTKVYDKELVELWSEFLPNVEIHCGDWAAACNNENAFYFFDPPYRESFTTYGAEFDDNEQLRLLDFCKLANDRGDKVFYCNRDDSNDGFFEANRGKLSVAHYDIKYTAGRRATETDGERTAKAAKEILLYSNNIEKIDPLTATFPDLFS